MFSPKNHLGRHRYPKFYFIKLVLQTIQTRYYCINEKKNAVVKLDDASRCCKTKSYMYS